MNKATVYLKPTKELKRRLLANHLLPGLVLIFTGLDALLAGERKNIFLILLSFLAGGLLFATVIIEMKRAGSAEHRVVGWVEVFAGLVLMVEGANHFHPGKGFQPAVLYWLVGLATVLLGFFHTKVSRIRRAAMDENGFLIRISPFRKLQMNWKEVAAIDFQDSEMRATTKDGQITKISLRQVANRGEVEAKFKEWVDSMHMKETAIYFDKEAKES